MPSHYFYMLLGFDLRAPIGAQAASSMLKRRTAAANDASADVAASGWIGLALVTEVGCLSEESRHERES